jgi:hypothetical protein
MEIGCRCILDDGIVPTREPACTLVPAVPGGRAALLLTLER